MPKFPPHNSTKTLTRHVSTLIFGIFPSLQFHPGLHLHPGLHFLPGLPLFPGLHPRVPLTAHFLRIIVPDCSMFESFSTAASIVTIHTLKITNYISYTNTHYTLTLLPLAAPPFPPTAPPGWRWRS